MRKVAHVASQVFSDNIACYITDIMYDEDDVSASDEGMSVAFVNMVSICIRQILRHSGRLPVSEILFCWVQDLFDDMGSVPRKCYATACEM